MDYNRWIVISEFADKWAFLEGRMIDTFKEKLQEEGREMLVYNLSRSIILMV